MSKDTKQKQKDYSDDWQFYEAILQDCHFEWPEPLHKSLDTAELNCQQYLNQLFNGNYRMTKFYLKSNYE